MSKTELLDQIWGDRFVSDSTLATRIKQARQAVGDDGQTQSIIRTAHGIGYELLPTPTEDTRDDGDDPDPAQRRGSDGSVVPGEVVLRRGLSPADRFIGRSDELAQIQARLDDTRLVTVIGPGGTGKTRLAVELADSLRADDHVAFVGLAGARSEHAVARSLAMALGVDASAQGDVVQACCAYLRARPVLLIIDNCEHVISSAARLVGELLAETTSTTVLATSRVPLGLRQEALFRLRPLPVPEGPTGLTPGSALGSAAVSLFVDRTARVRDDFELDERSLADVIAVCRALDGLPLAIELAAGRMGVFGLDDIVDRLDRRLDLLQDTSVETDARHRTLRATVEWSYDLLGADAKRLNRFLSVFPAGLTLDGIEWLGDRIGLADDALAALDQLAEASLVDHDHRWSGTRYVQLETMRAFGLDRLASAGELDEAADRSADRAIEFTATLDARLHSSDEARWDDRACREIPNLREGRERLLATGRLADLVTVSANLDEWARLRDVAELWSWADELLGLPLDGVDRSRAIAIVCQAEWRRGRMESAAELASELVPDEPDVWSRARGYTTLAVVQLYAGKFEAAAEAWATRAELDGYVIDLADTALARANTGDIDGARNIVSSLRRPIGATGSPSLIAWLDYVAGQISWLAGEPDCVQWLEAAVDGAAGVNATFVVGIAGLTVATAMQGQDRIGDAAHRYRELIEHWLRTGNWAQQWTTLRTRRRSSPMSTPSWQWSCSTSRPSIPRRQTGIEPRRDGSRNCEPRWSTASTTSS